MHTIPTYMGANARQAQFVASGRWGTRYDTCLPLSGLDFRSNTWIAELKPAAARARPGTGAFAPQDGGQGLFNASDTVADTGPVPPDSETRADLVALWRDLFREDPPRNLSQTFLRRFTAHEMQLRTHGGLPRKLVADLARLEAGPPRPALPGLQPGSRLLREWNGITHVVDITEAGCLWQGRQFRSLSAVAREITGAHWSGPRFFGLQQAGSGQGSGSGRPGKRGNGT